MKTNRSTEDSNKQDKNNKRRVSVTLVAGAFISALVAGLSTGITHALTYQSEADVVFTFNPTMTLNVSGDLIIGDLAPGSSADSNIVTVTAGSNSNAGYTVYANVGNSSKNYTDLRISSSDTNNKFRALTTAGTIGSGEWGYSYCTGTCSESAGTWVYGSTGSTSNGYGALPLYNDNSHSGDVVLADENSANTTNLSFKIGAKAEPAQAMGTYTNVVNFIGVPKVVTTSYTITYNGNSATSGVPSQQTGTTTEAIVTLNGTAPIKNGYTFRGWCDVSNTSDQGNCTGTITQAGNTYALNTTNPTFTKTFYAVWEENCPPNYICYKANGSNVIGTMGKQSISASATSATLLASNFSRTGYGFAGWSDSMYPATDTNAHLYGPQETIAFTAGQYSGTNGGLILYAVWVASAGSMQSAGSVCSNLNAAPANGNANLSSVSALTDQRDNQTYAIAKLADGNCWMIENLRLEAEDTRGDAKKALAQGYGTSGTYGNFSGLADAESANFTDSTTANSLYYSGTQEGTASIDIGTTNYPAYRMPRYNHTNTSDRATSPTTNGGAMYSYGNYYTWSAAMANTIYYSGPTATDADGKTSDNVNTSICPTGWRLPYGRTTGNGATAGGFSYLDIQLGGTGASQSTTEASNRWRKFPNNFLYSGYFNTSSAYNRGSYGYYWSSTAVNSYGSYLLSLGSSNVYPGSGGYNKYYGFSVRCVAPGS